MEFPLRHGVRLTVAYDGTDFSGWQRQDDQRTIQGELESALDRMGIPCTRIFGASRTDAGVHALAQVASFATSKEIPPRGWVQGLNGQLPQDIAVKAAFPAPKDYNPRFDTTKKTYRYLLSCGETRAPLLRRRSWWIGRALGRPDLSLRRPIAADWLDLPAMRRAIERLLGKHDFKAFKKRQDKRENTIREIERIDLVEGFGGDEGVLAIEVTGNAFLQHMVRILVGTLLEVGRHRMMPERMEALVAPEAERGLAGPTAPARGLCLVSMELGRKESWW